MNNRNTIIALMGAILSGTLAFFLLYQKASDIERKTTPIEVLFASHYIPAGSLLRNDMVEKKAIPESYISPSTIRDLREIDGLVSLVPISAGEQILSNKFGSGGDSLAYTLTNGYRAYTLEVNETSGVGNLIHPGNHVDILAKVSASKREITSFVFQDLTILAVGQNLTGVKREKGQGTGSTISSDSNTSYSTVTLAVTPEQAETLMYLDGQPLKLILRAPGDDEIVPIPAQGESEVLAKLGHFSPKSTHNLEIIRGTSSQENK